MGENKNIKPSYADPTVAEAVGNVERECRRKKLTTQAGCFALRAGKCSVLDVKKCEGLSCSFYKTEKQIQQERKKAFERIKSLDKSEQTDISKKYYGSKMPWLKEEI